MSIKLSASLDHIADILRTSMTIHADEVAPALPIQLLEDLTARFSAPTAVPVPPVPLAISGNSLFEKARSLFSSPAFGIAAAGLFTLTAALPLLLDLFDSPTTTHFRGSSTYIENSALIILVGASGEQISSLETSGDFEKEAIHTRDTASSAKVIVDFKNSTITSITANGEPIHTASLPAAQAEISTAIAEALSKF